MRKLLKALLLTAAASGAAYVLLDRLDFDAPAPSSEGSPPGMDPDEMPGEDVELLLKELASHLG